VNWGCWASEKPVSRLATGLGDMAERFAGCEWMVGGPTRRRDIIGGYLPKVRYREVTQLEQIPAALNRGIPKSLGVGESGGTDSV
jgi:hypothetical protein